MIKIIESTLNEYADMQLNLESQAARKFLAEKINSALLAEIRKRKPETLATDIMHNASIDAYHKNDWVFFIGYGYTDIMCNSVWYIHRQLILPQQNIKCW